MLYFTKYNLGLLWGAIQQLSRMHPKDIRRLHGISKVASLVQEMLKKGSTNQSYPLVSFFKSLIQGSYVALNEVSNVVNLTQEASSTFQCLRVVYVFGIYLNWIMPSSLRHNEPKFTRSCSKHSFIKVELKIVFSQLALQSQITYVFLFDH